MRTKLIAGLSVVLLLVSPIASRAGVHPLPDDPRVEKERDEQVKRETVPSAIAHPTPQREREQADDENRQKKRDDDEIGNPR